MRRGHAGMGPQLNVRRRLNLVDQVSRHGAGKRFAAHQNNDALRVSSEIHGRLAGGVRAPYHINDLTLIGQSLRRAAAIVNSSTLQLVYPRSLQPAPLHSARNHEGVARDLVPIRQFNDSVRTFGSDADSFLRSQDFHSETTGLNDGPPGQIAATEPGGKSEIVLDARTHTRLAAGRFPLNYHGMQTFGGAINRGGQTGGPTSHDR